MQSIRNIIKHVFKEGSLPYKIISKIYHFLSRQKYKIMHWHELKEQNKKYTDRVDEAVEIIKEHSNKEYIVFYNPTWLGVAASTKGLFKNYIPLEQVFGKKNVNKIAKAIGQSNIKNIIFSQIVDGWTDIIEKIKKENNDLNVKVIWHGNCYEFFSDYTWNLNKEVMKLYNEGKINCFGFVRSTMYEFYKRVGFKSCYLQNNVRKDNNGKDSTNQNEYTKIGIYNADSRELKNIYTALSAMSLIPNVVADIVPINEGAKAFTEILGLKNESLEDYISNDDLMKRIQGNDINIYPTFTENAPMFPLESFEMGVPCLLGNNNDYFVGTELGEYVILKREDDPVYIKERIINALNNREKIMKLYREWKLDFNKKCDEYVQEFINA